MEQSHIQAFLWQHSRVTTAVFGAFCAHDANDVGDHPQLSYEQCMRFLDTVNPVDDGLEDTGFVLRFLFRY